MDTENTNFASLQRWKLARIPAAFKTVSSFVRGLPEVSYADLPNNEHDRSCHICHENFTVPGQRSEYSEEAVKLPCGHIFGVECLTSFFSVQSSRLTCPMCRDQLPVITTENYEREEDYRHLLLWVARQSRGWGAALDRQLQVWKASKWAGHHGRAWSILCVHHNGITGPLDEQYLEYMDRISDLDPWNPDSSKWLEDLNDCIEYLMLRFWTLVPDRMAPYWPKTGRRFKITKILARSSQPSIVSDQPGERIVFEEAICEGGLLEGQAINTAGWPAWMTESLTKDFAAVPTDQIWDELRRRRFVANVKNISLDDEFLAKMAASLEISDEDLQLYARDYPSREAPGQLGRHWGINSASDTLYHLSRHQLRRANRDV